jgi:hypothetical protein
MTATPGGEQRFQPWEVDGPVHVSGIFRIGRDRTALRVVDVETQADYSQLGRFWAAWRAYERRYINGVEFGDQVRRLDRLAGLRFEHDADRVTAIMELVDPADLVFESYSGDEAAR